MAKTVQIARIAFPEIELPERAAHHLRGYFGRLFQERSPLLHNHFEDGSLRYGYPLVQYKVAFGTPTLVGLGEGAELLTELFLKIDELDIEGRRIPVLGKNIRIEQAEAGCNATALHEYGFATQWLALSQKNFQAYEREGADERHGVDLVRSDGSKIFFAHSHYSANAGINQPWGRATPYCYDFDIPEPVPGARDCLIDGPFYPNSKVTVAMVTDGLSNTVFIGENSSILCHKTWVGVVPTAVTLMVRMFCVS